VAVTQSVYFACGLRATEFVVVKLHLALRKELRLRALRNIVLRIILDTRRDDITGRWRTL
jgi:hypothetical protein